MIQLLAEFAANFNAADQQGTTALMKATASGHVDLVAFLIANGAELNATDSKGSTALVYAAKAGHNDIVQLLLSCPSWPSISNKFNSWSFFSTAYLKSSFPFRRKH